MPNEGRRVDGDLGEFEFEEWVLEAIDGAPDTLRESDGEGGAGRLEKKSVVSMDVDVGLLEVGFEFEQVLGVFGSIEETRVDRFGMIIGVPRWFSFSSSASPFLVKGMEEGVGVVADVVVIVADRGVNAAVVRPRLSTLTDRVFRVSLTDSDSFPLREELESELELGE
jgi:hypothetical protein